MFSKTVKKLKLLSLLLPFLFQERFLPASTSSTGQ